MDGWFAIKFLRSLSREESFSSFEVMDNIITHIIYSEKFPNLTQIILTGFSEVVSSLIDTQHQTEFKKIWKMNLILSLNIW